MWSSLMEREAAARGLWECPRLCVVLGLTAGDGCDRQEGLETILSSEGRTGQAGQGRAGLGWVGRWHDCTQPGVSEEDSRISI